MKRLLMILVVLALVLSACAPAATPAPAPATEVNPAEEQKPAEEAKPAEEQKPAEEAKPAEEKPAEKITIRGLFMKQASYQESDIQAMSKEFMDKNPNVTVEMDFVTYEALHDKIVTAAASKAGTYDVVLMDCIWPAEFAAAGFILDVTDRISEDMKKDIWPGAMEAVTYQGKVYGMPWVNDVLYLYYNEEMLKAAGFDKPPKTWTELESMAMAAKEKKLVEYPFIESFPQEEGLTIAFAYYLLSFGGKFFDEENKPAFNSPEGLATLNYMIKGMKEGMYNPASLESTYEEVRNTFSQGASLFSVNWAYQYNLANDPKESQIPGKAMVTILPGEKLPSATINGGMGLAVSSDSKHPEEAWQYILYLSSQDVQKRYAANSMPIWMSLFEDPEVVKLQPVMVETSKEAYKYIMNRPQVPFYSETHKIIEREVQAALTEKKSAEAALKDAEAEILKVREQYQQ